MQYLLFFFGGCIIGIGMAYSVLYLVRRELTDDLYREAFQLGYQAGKGGK